MATQGEAYGNHDGAAEGELPARQEHGVMARREPLGEVARGGGSHGGGKDEPLALKREGEPAGLPGDVHEDDARKAYEATYDLAGGEALEPEREGGEKNADEGVARLEDRARDPRAIGKTHVEEHVLDDGLEEGEDADGGEVAPAGDEGPAGGQAHPDDHHEAGKEEAHPREGDDGGDIGGVHGEELVADLHARERRAPQEARRKARQHHPRHRGEKWLGLLMTHEGTP